MTPTQVGRATTFTSLDSGSPSTALPAGTSVGDVIVSYIESHSFASVLCNAHWTRVIDLAKPGGARLVACVVADTGIRPEPVAELSPPGEVSMVTMAFSGTNFRHPIESSAVGVGAVSPSIAVKTTGAMLVLGEGNDSLRAVARVPKRAKRGASVNDGRNSQVAVATVSVLTAGLSPPTAWDVTAQGSTVAGTVALRPATPGVRVLSARVCGNSSVLSGPGKAPKGAVTVPAGNNAILRMNRAHTTYYFDTGKHTLGSSEYSQIIPNNGDVYIGAPGAIIDGQGLNDSAFTNNATGVTIEYLTIQNFTPPGGQGAVNHNSGENWTIAHDTIQDNSPGAGMMIGSDDIVSGNCLTKNGEYGFNAYLDPTSASASSLTGGPVNVTLTGNEISDNDTYNWETVQPGCGCSGGGKFWKVDGATITGNYIHDNLGGAGIWADTDNTGFNISGNYFANNYGPAVEYEISYNAQITDNTFVDNAWGAGAANPGFPTGAIYASESGGDSRVPGYSSGSFSILNNTFTDNWSGVVLWESADRFCSSPSQPSADCVLTDPTLFYYNSSATAPGGCGEADLTGATPGTNSGTPPADYYDGCRWKTQNVTVASNTFDFTQANVPGCTLSANSCGENAIFSQYGTYPSWSPYKAYAVEDALTAHQDNVFSDNTYSGPWSFMYRDQFRVMNYSRWRSIYHQDPSSTLTSDLAPPNQGPPATPGT